MAKKVFNLYFLFFLSAFFLLLLDFSLCSSLAQKPIPLWWDIKIVILGDGEYKLEQNKISYSGDYSFKIVWIGTIEREKDDKDYIQENKRSPELVKTKAGKDFKRSPTFRLNYILRKKENLHFDFLVEGFPIPQNESDCKIYLHMPCYSEKSKLNPEMQYDSFITEGSNQVFLGEREIYDVPVKREFSWTWQLKKWILGFKHPTFLTNLHKAKLRLSITPQFLKKLSFLHFPYHP